MITNHTELLQALIDKHGLKSYLEIGVQDPANNLNKIKCKNRIGVDPCLEGNTVHLSDKVEFILMGETSDVFFALNNKHNRLSNIGPIDLIFIDGLHHADQVKRDFDNALANLTDGGRIVIHDCLPEREDTTHVPRDSRVWHGDVYKFCMTLHEYEDIDYVTYNIDHGCCVVWKKPGHSNFQAMPPVQLTWPFFQSYGRQLLKVQDGVTI